MKTYFKGISMWKCFEKFVLNFAKFYVKLSWKLSLRLKATSLTDRVSHLNHVNHLKRPRHVRCFLQKYFVYYHVGVSPMEWTGKNAAKNHLRLVIASIFIADLRLRDTHKSRFWNRSSFPVFSNNIMLSFYLAIPLYLPKCYELLVEVRLGSGWIGWFSDSVLALVLFILATLFEKHFAKVWVNKLHAVWLFA